VLLVGNPALPLKGFDVALAVLAAVGRLQRLEVTWVCQARADVGCRVDRGRCRVGSLSH